MFVQTAGLGELLAAVVALELLLPRVHWEVLGEGGVAGEGAGAVRTLGSTPAYL